MIDFHIIVGIGKIAGHARSLRSLRSLQLLCFDFRMIAGTVVIVSITGKPALVFSILSLRSLTILHDRYDRGDRL